MATLEQTPLQQAIAERRIALLASGTPHYAYVERGDYLSVFFTDDLYHAERIDELLTVYRSIETDELVGCKIKGVSILARNANCQKNQFEIEDGATTLSLAVLLYHANPVEEVKHHYWNVGKQAELLQFKIPANILKAA